MIPGVRIALWKPEETPEELLSILGNTHLYESIMTSCKTEKRKIEKLTTRILINLLQKGEAEMKYNDNGKPYLVSSSEYISVSHTQCCIAVAISSRPIPYRYRRYGRDNRGVPVQRSLATSDREMDLQPSYDHMGRRHTI